MEARYKTLRELKAAADRKGIVSDWSLTIDEEGIKVRELIANDDDEFGDTLFYAKDFKDLLSKLF